MAGGLSINKSKHSLKDYIYNRFYNEMFSAIKSFVIQNRNFLDLRSRTLDSISYVELSDIKILNIYIYDQPELKISFDVILDAELDLSDYNRHNDSFDIVNQWFRLSCTGDLECSLDDFAINEVSVFDKKKHQDKPLSETLVPYIRKEELDDYATAFLSANYPEALETPVYLDPMELAKRMALDVKLTCITKELSIFGASFFQDCESEYYDKKADSMKPLQIKAGTILVDENAFYLRNLGSVNNTIVHECVHWFFHKKAFALEHLYNENISQIKCQVVGGIKDNNYRSTTDWMEWQANSLTPRIQMPLKTFKIKAQELISKYKVKLKTIELVDVLEPVINELAQFFGVSICAAKIRLIDVGYSEAIGVFTYIDGKYVKPHAFKKNSITKKQTFSISKKDALVQSVFSPELKKYLQEDKYKYIGSHFVFNSPKYIASDNGELSLTEYARLHIDECCLIFDLTVKAINKYGEDYYTECVLFRDAASNITFEAKFSSENKGHLSDTEQYKRYIQDVLSIAKTLPNNFPEALDTLIKWSELTEEQIAERSDLSTRTIQRLRNDDTQNVKLETVLQLCIGMKLPFQLSKALIERSGNAFKTNEQDFSYEFLITAYSGRTLYECNEFLRGIGQPVLGKTAKE